MHTSSELSQVLDDISRRLHLERRTYSPRLFRDAVEVWCEKLGWPLEAASLGLELDRDQAAHLWRLAFAFDAVVKKPKGKLGQGAENLYKKVKRLPVFGPSQQVHPGDYIRARDEAMSKMEAKDYLLIALAVAAAGYVIYIYRLAPQPLECRGAPPTRPAAVPTRWVLVLVINAGRHGVIDALRSGGVAALEGDQLYQATQALWLGTEADFQRSNLSEWFSEARAVAEPSEYDVHLVRVELSSDDPGLHRNANQMDRLDAFRRFQSMGFKATVSPRLPSDAYGTTDVYSR
ncbi:MAG TPA: hypothetical protein PLQ97_08920 [Myxococcota bacterium]|nr:hypothetical protein [Myxococcota bacterium]HQK51333.1 hypothetical protein [Myxococcota bacterium]